MEHQNINVMIRSKKTAMTPISYLLTCTSSPPKLIWVAVQVAKSRYFQLLALAVVSVQASIGRSLSSN